MTTATAEAPTTQLIALDKIRPDKHNARIKECEDTDALKALADDMAAVGQLQPIGVVAAGDGYTIVWGERRYHAARLAGWKHIAAVELPAEGFDVERAQAAENLHRRAMNPLEECMAVTRLWNRQSNQALSDEQKAKAVGAIMGKSATWVRDRIYLNRLSPQIREFVVNGSMPLAAAREFAKLADHGQQDQVYKELMRYNRSMPHADQVRNMVSQWVLALSDAPFSLTAGGIAKTGPCSECVHNSSNADKGLFEHDGKTPALGESRWSEKERNYVKPKGPFCLNASCYGTKAKAVQDDVQRVAKLTIKGEPVKHADHINPEAIKRSVESIQAAAAERAKGGKGKKAEVSTAERERRYQEQEKARRAKEARAKAQHKKTVAALSKVPGAMTLGLVLAYLPYKLHGEFFGKGTSSSKRKLPPKGAAALRRLVDGGITIQQLDGLVAPLYAEYGYECPLHMLADVGTHVDEYLAQLFGTAEPEPEVPAKGKKSPGKKPSKAVARA